MNKNTKRLCSLIMTVTIVCCLLSCSFFARATSALPEFSVSDVTAAHPGDTVSVTVDANANRGFCAGEFTLTYDPEVLTPVSVDKGDAAGSYFVANKDYDEGKVFFAMIDEHLISEQGAIAIIDFTVNDSVLLYSGEFGLSVGSLVGDISIGYGYNSVSSSATGGELHAAKLITVPDSDEPSTFEELEVLQGFFGETLLSGTKVNNLVVESISDNFPAALTIKYFDRTHSTLTAQQRLTTDCVIEIYEDNVLKHTLTVSAKGDANGDYSVDGMDAFLAGMQANGMLTEDDIGWAASNASDVNSDGTVDQSDFDLLEQSGLNP